jgi:hypothetical protein
MFARARNLLLYSADILEERFPEILRDEAIATKVPGVCMWVSVAARGACLAKGSPLRSILY